MNFIRGIIERPREIWQSVIWFGPRIDTTDSVETTLGELMDECLGEL